MSQIIIAAVITAVIVAFLSWNLAIAYRKRTYESKIGSAEVKSREIIEEALKTAETKKREAMLEAKEEALRTKNELERETKERRAELQHYENRVLSKSESRPCSRKRRALRREAVRWILSTTEVWKSWSALPDSRWSRRRNSCFVRLRTM